ncbi:MAG: GNAT family protein [Candidatus Dormiibacterota bacterium]
MKTPRASITLREFRPDDVEAAAAWISDPIVTRFLTWDAGDREAARRWIRAAMASASAVPRRTWELAAVDARSEVVGAGRLTVREPSQRAGDLGYVVRRDRWGQGVGTAIARAFLELGFDRLALHRIWATCDVDNLASARVLEHAGLEREGRLRDQLLVRGRWHDAYLYAIVRAEPERARSHFS